MTSIVAVVEGLNINLLKSYLPKIELPWWSKTLSKYNCYQVNCGPVPYEPTNLSTAFTGTTPGHHGVSSFWEIHSNNSLPRILTSSDVLVPQIWHWPSFKHIRAAVINTPITHPPSPLSGMMVSYPMQQTLHATYPRKLQFELNEKDLKCAHDVSAFYKGEPVEKFYQSIYNIANAQLQTTLELAKSSDIVFVNLTIADRLSHFFWSELSSASTSNEPSIIKAYRFLDKALFQLEALLNDNDFMMVFSEIGFGPIDGFVSIDHYLQAIGLQELNIDGSVDHTKSHAMEAVQGSHGINIVLNEKNLFHRRSNPDYRHKLNVTKNALLSMRFGDGNPIISRVFEAEELYDGPYTALMPDLIIQPANPARPPLGDPRWAKHVNRHLQTGWHRDDGFFVLLGNRAIKSQHAKPIDLENIAPTIADLMRCDIPSSCIGKSMM